MRIERLVEVRRHVAIQARLVTIEIGEKKIAADPAHYRRDIALHAWHVAYRHAEADEAGRVLDMDVAEERRRPRPRPTR